MKNTSFIRRYILFFAFATILFVPINMNAQKRCGSDFNLNSIKQNDPVRYQEILRIEKQTQDYVNKMKNTAARLIDENGTITIPIVVHIIHKNEPIGVGTNLSDAQVQSQIDVLNEDFNRLNSDQTNTRPEWSPKAGVPNFQFQLACFDPNGGNTNGIVRSVRPTFSTFPPTETTYNAETNNAKFTNLGGQDAWATERYLNIWVVPTLSNNNLPIWGYAQSPDEFAQKSDRDGVVVLYKAFGRGFSNLEPQYNQGRTTTHEVAHWLNLKHVYEGGCAGTDFCDDTPPQQGGNFGCVTFPHITCNNGPNGDMFQNYMDVSDDACMNLFTKDQTLRMRAVFQSGGVRRSFTDNYFKLTQAYQNCSQGFYIVKTPFCSVNGNITWNITGPATLSNNGSTTTNYVNIQSGANGIAIVTASWNNFASDISIPLGYGTESSTYTTYDNYNSGSPVLTLRSGGFYSAKTSTYGTVSFTGANGVAKNWRIFSQSGQAYLNGNGNNFSLSVYPNSNVTIRADIPTACGDRMVQYTFYRSSYQYRLAPNPASNNITITASNINANPDPNARATTETPEYEVQIFTRYNQLMKKTKCAKGAKDITIDVSSLPSNQLYTVQLISSEDVQVKSFFKE